MKVCVVIVCLLFAYNYASADQNDPRLGNLFAELKTSPDPEGAHAIEMQIWAIWMRSGEDATDEWMKIGTGAMAAGDYDTAIRFFGRIVDHKPEFAEGWNKRATAYYLKHNLDASVRDVQRTLALEPRHFGALAGMGLIFTEVGDYQAAIKAYQDVLHLHPQSIGARINLEQLHNRLQNNTI